MSKIRQAIREQHLLTIAGTMGYLNWHPNSCATCRHGAELHNDFHPGQVKPRRSAIAPDQRTGPRQYSERQRLLRRPTDVGGVTNPSELRRIADVADKYNVPMVKVTGGQRIDLLGIEAGLAHGVWKDLDMPSAACWQIRPRHVKTCVSLEVLALRPAGAHTAGNRTGHDLLACGRRAR